MANFLKKALLSMFVDEKGREALEAHKAARPPLLQDSKVGVPPAPVVAPANPAARTELIRKAIAVRREQSKVLDSLSKVDRLKLQAMAQKAFNIKKKDGGKDH
jgi:hypothetical protein